MKYLSIRITVKYVYYLHLTLIALKYSLVISIPNP